MLTAVLAHAGAPVAPHDVWGAWTFDPLVIAGLLLAGWLYHRGGPGAAGAGGGWRARAFVAGLAALAVALISPLDALSGALASAHMGQHLLLVLVAAPLLALSAPSARLLRGSPLRVRRASGRWRRRLRLTPATLRLARQPAVAWGLYVAVLWIWHGAVPYTAAVEHDLWHVVEHATLFVTALLFWTVVVGTHHRREGSDGTAILLVFGSGLASVFLAVLLTFARSAWYPAYATTTAAFGLSPLADQQLAGVLLWVPAGAIHLAAGLLLVARWLRSTEDDASAATGQTVH